MKRKPRPWQSVPYRACPNYRAYRRQPPANPPRVSWRAPRLAASLPLRVVLYPRRGRRHGYCLLSRQSRPTAMAATRRSLNVFVLRYPELSRSATARHAPRRRWRRYQDRPGGQRAIGARGADGHRMIAGLRHLLRPPGLTPDNRLSVHGYTDVRASTRPDDQGLPLPPDDGAGHAVACHRGDRFDCRR
jgi:hypothetical protein